MTKEKIKGYIAYFVYPKGGPDPTADIQWCAFDVKTKEKRVRCAGKVLYMECGDYYEFTGNWDDDKHKKFSVDMAVRCTDDEEGTRAVLKFVYGEKTSAKILDVYKGDSMLCWDEFKNHQDVFFYKVSKVKGIGKKKIEKGFEKWEDYIGVDVILQKYQNYGLTLEQAFKIFTKWGTKSEEKISQNPYILRLVGIKFDLMDKIALREYGMAEDNPERVYTGAYYALKRVESMGHCYIRLKTYDKIRGLKSLKAEVQSLLKLDNTTAIDEQLVKLFDEGKLVRKKHRLSEIVCFPDMDKAEEYIAKKVLGLLHPTIYKIEEIEKDMVDFEENNFELDGLQKNAIRNSLTNQFSIISGPPGAGKTTIIDAIVTILKKINKSVDIQMCSPTGKAAQRMRESTGFKAETIHRLLEFDPVSEDFTRNENNPLLCDVLIIDEFSMCDTRLFCSLLKAVQDNCQVIIVGDKDQLPSIGPGKILQDLLSLNFIPKTILTKVYRQAEGSFILKDALAIGKEDLAEIKNFRDADDLKFHDFQDSENIDKLQRAAVAKFLEGVKTYGLENVCIMTPTNKNELGTIRLNEIIQEQINPLDNPENEMRSGGRKFRIKDRVIQTKNEPQYDIFNGDTGTIIEIIHGNHKTGERDTIVVDFGKDKIVEYNRDRFENLKLAYSLTIHKLQGSEYPLCIMILHRSHIYQLEKRLIYTGWTRARKELDIFGDKALIEYAVTHKSPERNSMLIQNFHKFKK